MDAIEFLRNKKEKPDAVEFLKSKRSAIDFLRAPVEEEESIFPKDIEPLPEADVSVPPVVKAATAFATVPPLFTLGAFATPVMSILDESERDQELDIPGEPDVGGRFKIPELDPFLRKYTETFEIISGYPSQKILESDKGAIKISEDTVGKIDVFSQKLGDVYTNQLLEGIERQKDTLTPEEYEKHRMDAYNIGATVKSSVDSIIWLGIPGFLKRVHTNIKMGKLREATRLMEDALGGIEDPGAMVVKNKARAKEGMPLLKPKEIEPSTAVRPTEVKVTPQERPPAPHGLEKGVPKPEPPLTTGVTPEEFLAVEKPTIEGPALREEVPPTEVPVKESKVGEPLLKPGWQGIIEVAKDINTAFGERGSIMGDRTAVQQAAIDRIKSRGKEALREINERAGDAGKTINEYLRNKGYHPDVADSIQKYIEQSFEEPRPVKTTEEGEVTVTENDGTPIPEELKTSRDHVQEMEAITPMESGVGGWTKLKRDIANWWFPMKDAFRYLGGKIGVQIHRLSSNAERLYKDWVYTLLDEFKDVAGRKVKKGTEDSLWVGKALDGQINAEQLTPKQRKIYDYLKDKFDFLINFYARQKVPNEQRFSMIAKSARRVVALNEEMAKIKGSNNVDDLSPENAKKYRTLQKRKKAYLDNRLKELAPEEQEALRLLSRKIKDYLPHIFDREILISLLKQNLERYTKKLNKAKKKDKKARGRYQRAIDATNESLSRVRGGELITYEQLPRNIENQFFKPRKGIEGYSFDAVGAYESYLYQMGRKLFYDPMLREIKELHKLLPTDDAKRFNMWYTRDFLGYNQKYFEGITNFTTSAQWLRTLGVNPKSAVGNLSQRMNTVVEMGPFYSAKAEKWIWTDEGKAWFDKTGVSREIPNIMYEGGSEGFVNEKLEMLRRYGGALFNKVEKGNRHHAGAAGYLKAKGKEITLREGWRYHLIEPDILKLKDFKKAMKDPVRQKAARDKLKNLTEEECTQFGIDVAHETQFRYGKTGTPRALRTAVGRVGLQFSSFTVNQIAWLARLGKREPMKLAKWIAAAEGGNILLHQFADTDMSNYFGFGTCWSEIFNALKSATAGDLRKAHLHTKLAFSGGTGILPTGPGPTVTSAWALLKAARKNKFWKQFKKEISPVQLNRIIKAWESIDNRNSQGYPYFNSEGRLMFYIDGWALMRNTFGPSSAKVYDEYKERSLKFLYERDYNDIIDEITSAAVIDGDMERHDELIKETGIWPTAESYVNKAYSHKLTDKQREIISGRFKSKQRSYQSRKEGE